MSNVIVKDNESLDSALRRFKRNCAKAGIQQEIRKRDARRSLKPPENGNTINYAKKRTVRRGGSFFCPILID